MRTFHQVLQARPLPPVLIRVSRGPIPSSQHAFSCPYSVHKVLNNRLSQISIFLGVLQSLAQLASVLTQAHPAHLTRCCNLYLAARSGQPHHIVLHVTRRADNSSLPPVSPIVGPQVLHICALLRSGCADCGLSISLAALLQHLSRSSKVGREQIQQSAVRVLHSERGGKLFHCRLPDTMLLSDGSVVRVVLSIDVCCTTPDACPWRRVYRARPRTL